MRKLLALLLPFVLCGFVHATWTKKNDQTGSGTANPQSAAAFSAPLTNGSVVIVLMFRLTNAIIAPTDTAGHTFVDCGGGSVLGVGSTLNIQCFKACNTVATASNVVSESNAVGDFVKLVALEFTGNDASCTVETHPVNPNATSGVGGGQNITSTAATTTTNGDLMVGVTAPNAGTLTTGTGFTSASDSIAEYQIQSAAGSIAATWHDSANNDTYGALGAAFKPASGVTIKPMPAAVY